MTLVSKENDGGHTLNVKYRLGADCPVGAQQSFNLKCIRMAFPNFTAAGGESGATRTPIPAQGGQQSGDCGQQVIAA